MKFTFAPESRPLEGYTIKRAIYRGGFGEVYYALTDAGREVALKLLQNNTDVELRGVQQCLNLSHPNLVTIFDIRQDAEGDHWILMEYVAGETLDTALRRTPHGMPMEEIRRWLPGLAAGVTFLHDRGIVHRDLKPGNVFIENGVVKVGDVGLSKFIAPSKRSAHTQSVGTVYYMAPEVAKGKYGKEVDVYAIGIMLYEMLTGHVPFDGESTGEILMKHLSAPPDLSVLPPRLQPVIARALEKDPARRFANVTALAESFERAVLGKPVVLEIPDAAFSHAGTNGSPLRGHGPTQSGNAVAQNGSPSADFWRRHTSFKGVDVWVVVGLVGLLLTAGIGLPPLGAVSLAAIAYGLHRGSRRPATPAPALTNLTLGPLFEPSPVAPTRHRQPGERPFNHRVAVKRAVLTPRTVRRVSVRDRAAHFAEAASVSALLTAVFTGCIALFAPEFFGSIHGVANSIEPALVGLFGGTALCGVWSLLGVNSLLEGRPIGPGLRRLISLLLGCVVGEAAWGLSEVLYLDLPESENGLFTSINSNPLTDGFGPTWFGFIVFFGLLFGLRRWWWQTDSYRPKRFRVMSVLLTMLVAAALPAVFTFPLGWAVVWAGVISSVVQLSSAWTPPAARIEG